MSPAGAARKPNAKTRRSRPKLPVISLFTGAGGLDYGLGAAGFETAVCVEMDKWCCNTLRTNRNWPVLESPIEALSSTSIMGTAGLKQGEAALLAGGPPCQPFSKSGYWANGDAGRLDDPRAGTLHHYMRVLEETLPQVFLLENVFGIAYKGKDEGLVFLRECLAEINKRNATNYSFEWKVLNASHYGVPQIRERVFIVGARDGSSFKFPDGRFGLNDSDQPDLFAGAKELPRNAWDAIGDLDDPAEDSATSSVGGKWGDLLPSIPEGENYLWHSERRGGKPLFGWRSRYWSFLLKLAKGRPSWTIQAQPGTAIGPFHWKNRRLTMREMARIQTFPDDVSVCGGISHLQRQIGNAVPSLLAEVLGREIRKQFLGRPTRAKLKLLPPLRTPLPAAEAVQPVMRKYVTVPMSERAYSDETHTQRERHRPTPSDA